MKALRIVQIVVLVALVGYLSLLHQANPANLALPFMISTPPAFVVAIALALGWLVGWLPGTLSGWRRERELRRAQRRIAELEAQLLPAEPDEWTQPVIPDRNPARSAPVVEGQENV